MLPESQAVLGEEQLLLSRLQGPSFNFFSALALEKTFFIDLTT